MDSSSNNSTFYNLSNVNSTLDLYYNSTDSVSVDVLNKTTKTQLTILENSYRPNATDKKFFTMPITIDSSLNNDLTTTESINKNTEILKSNMENKFTINSKSMYSTSSIENENHLTKSKTDFDKVHSTEIPISTKENEKSGTLSTLLNDKEILLPTDSMRLTASSTTSTKRYSTSKITNKLLEISTEISKINKLDNNESLIKTTKEIEKIKDNSGLSTKNVVDEKSGILTTDKSITTTENPNEKQMEKKTKIKETSKLTTEKFTTSKNGKSTMKIENPNEKQMKKETSKFTTEKFTTSTNGKSTKKIENKNKNEKENQNGNSIKYSTEFQRKPTTGKSSKKPKRNETKKNPFTTMPTLPTDFKTNQPFKTRENRTTQFLNYKLKQKLSSSTPNFLNSGAIRNTYLKSDHSLTFFNSETTTEPNHTMGAGPLVIVVLLPFLALFLIAVVTALRRKMKKSRGRIVRVQSRDMVNFSDRNQSQMIPLTIPDNNDIN